MNGRTTDVAAKIADWKTWPLSDPRWHLVWETFKAYGSGRQADISWRRLRTPAAIAKAKYVSRVAYRAMKGRALPDGHAWGFLRVALKVIYNDLEGP